MTPVYASPLMKTYKYTPGTDMTPVYASPLMKTY